MTDVGYLKEMETFFMALADKTRLRLLNLMAEDEVCVCFFTEILGDSQPKISRHLAYLRNANLVEARREGKWMHYGINWPSDPGRRGILQDTLAAIGQNAEMQRDKSNYENVCCSPELLVQIARTPINFISPKADVYEPAAPSVRTSHNELDEFLL